MKIIEINPKTNGILQIVSEDDRIGTFDVNPYFKYEAFEVLKDQNAFEKIFNGGYLLNGTAVLIYLQIQ